MESRSERPWRRRAAALCIGLAGALAAAELAARAVLPAEVPRAPYNPATGPGGVRQTNYRPVPHPELAFVLRPGSTTEMVYPAYGDHPERRVRYEVNEAGFRDRSYATEKAPGVHRIAVLGDSFTHGNGLHLEETFPKVMERVLAETPGCPPAEVLNCGVGGYNTRQEVELLKWRVLAFRPDTVLIAYYVNDVLPPYGSPAETAERPEHRLPRWLAPPADGAETSSVQRLVAAAVRRSRLVRYLVEGLRAKAVERAHRRRFDAHYEDQSPGWQRVRAAFTEARDLAARHGFDLRVTVFPNPAYPGHNPFRRHEARVEQLCAELGVPFHDLSSVYAGRTAGELTVHPHDAHGSPLCNELIGRELARQLCPLLGSSRE